jgi:hypothetical protein
LNGERNSGVRTPKYQLPAFASPTFFPQRMLMFLVMAKITVDNFLNILLVCAQYVFSEVGTDFVDM